MSDEQQEFFWIIFDTCTRPQYYQDVHNILALPEGFVYRYDYRLSQMSSSAIQSATSQLHGKVLLIYAQTDDYHKGNVSPSPETPTEKILWIATRLADVTLIPSQEGETFYFDLKLTKYPSSNQEALRKILEPLISSGETPFRKWVTTSRDFDNLHTLYSGEDDNNWESIINSLGKSPFQFEGDYFWRLRVPFQVNNGKKLNIKYQEIPIKGTTEIRKVNSFYDAEEGLKGAFELTTYIPTYFPENQQQAVQISMNEKDPIYVVGISKFELRPHSAEMLKFATSRSDPLTASMGSILIESGHGGNGWPLGPNLKIEIRVFKPIWKVVSAIILILSSAYLGILSATWIEQNSNIAIVTGLLSAICLALASILLFARLKVAE